MWDNYLLLGFARLLFITTVIGVTDITTVYKFNTIYSGLESPRYANSCTVSVHVQDNGRGLPLFNMNGKNSLFLTIPPLYSGTNSTGWQELASNGTLLPLSSFQSNAPDSLEIFKWTPSIKYNLLGNRTISTFGSVTRTKDSNVYEKIVGMDDRNTFLVVRFQEKTARQQGVIIKFYFGPNFIITITFSSKYEFSVCSNLNSSCYNSKISHGILGDEQAFIYVGVNTGRVIIFDRNSFKIHNTGINIPREHGKLTLIKHVYSYSKTYGDPVKYELEQINLMGESDTLVSPWLDIKRNTSLFILYYRMNVNETLSVYIEEQFTGNVILLESQDIDQVNLIKDPDQERVDQIKLERVLQKVNVKNPKLWTGNTRIKIKINQAMVHIGNVWEGREEQIIKKFKKNNCAKSDFKEIYIVPEEQVENVDQHVTCYNGGRLDNSACRCPPGFAGNQCETPCGRNLFGQTCSNLCSKSPSECKGMVLCTPSYGCSCAPGYHGDQCSVKCEDGFYGADCEQNCGKWCEDGCDIYTGTCRGKCKMPHSNGPSCNQFHSYLREFPQVVDSSFTSVKLGINLSANNIIKSNDNTLFYMVQYREGMDTNWYNGSYKIFNASIFITTVEGLNPGHIYYFRVLLIDESLEIHDPDMAKFSKGYTKCIISDLGNDLKTTTVTNTSIGLIWKEIEGQNECPCASYILEVEETVDGYVETFRFGNIKTTSFEIENLAPSQTYRIVLKKLTVYGESNPAASTTVTTDNSIDLSMEIAGVRITKTDTQVEIKWFPSPLYKTFYIKCKLNRHMCCGNEKIDSPLQVGITNHTSYNISYDNLKPFAEYQVFVTADKNQALKLNNFSFITKSKLPEDSPVYFKNKEKITNESAELYWMDFLQSCQQMNGIFNNYLIELYDIHSMNPLSYETTANHLLLTNLLPHTQYSVKLRYVNHIGYNLRKFTEYNFTTKSTSILVVQELTAYKTSSNLLGLRWKLPQTNSTIIGINIQLETEIWNKTLTVPPDLSTSYCRAWPSYICFDVTELKPNTRYSITVNILSNLSPSGEGLSRPIHAITKENISLPVSDVKIEQISEGNMTVSWQIPSLLNGILSKFLIEVEHLSSFDEVLCCKSKVMIEHEVSQEQERYSHVLTDIYSASSYQITIRPFTKRLGPPQHKIIDTPPLQQSITYMPRVKLNNKIIDLKEFKTTHFATEHQQLAKEILILVQDFSAEMSDIKIKELSSFRYELDQILGNHLWWLAYICAAGNEDCSVDLGDRSHQDFADTYYGIVSTKELLIGHDYEIIVVQVNKYQSAKSYTIARSQKFKLL